MEGIEFGLTLVQEKMSTRQLLLLWTSLIHSNEALYLNRRMNKTQKPI